MKILNWCPPPRCTCASWPGLWLRDLGVTQHSAWHRHIVKNSVWASGYGSAWVRRVLSHTRISCCFQRCLGFKWLENLQLLSMKSHLHAWAITRIPVGFQEANAGKAGLVMMSLTCHLQGQIHPCYNSCNFTAATHQRWLRFNEFHRCMR